MTRNEGHYFRRKYMLPNLRVVGLRAFCFTCRVYLKAGSSGVVPRKGRLLTVCP